MSAIQLQQQDSSDLNARAPETSTQPSHYESPPGNENQNLINHEVNQDDNTPMAQQSSNSVTRQNPFDSYNITVEQTRVPTAEARQPEQQDGLSPFLTQP